VTPDFINPKGNAILAQPSKSGMDRSGPGYRQQIVVERGSADLFRSLWCGIMHDNRRWPTIETAGALGFESVIGES
jgi:hypothetical protein